MSINSANLTAKQKKVYAAIESYITLNGIPPTVREIGELVGEKTPGAVQGILTRLEQKGVIKRQVGAARSIQLVKTDNQIYETPVYIPQIKKITVRNIDNITSIYNIEKYRPVSPEFLNSDGDYFIMNCPDDDLLESGFGPDDIIIINTTAEPHDGDIVLVFYENRTYMRRYFAQSDGTITLKFDTSVIDKENFTREEIRIVGKIEGRYTRLP